MDLGMFNPNHYCGSEYVAIGMAVNATPLNMHFLVTYLDDDNETRLWKVEQYPVAGWVTVAQLDDDGRILDTEIQPGFFEPTELQVIVTAKMWSDFGGDELIRVLPTGEEPDQEDVDRARTTLLRRLARSAS